MDVQSIENRAYTFVSKQTNFFLTILPYTKKVYKLFGGLTYMSYLWYNQIKIEYMSYAAWINDVTGIEGWTPIVERYNTLTFRNEYYPGYCIWATPGFNGSNNLPVSVTDEFGNELHSATFSMKGWDFNKFQEMIDRAIQITNKKIG